VGSLARQSLAARHSLRRLSVIAALGIAAACGDHTPVAPRIAPGHARLSVAPRYAKLPDGAPIIVLSKVRGVLIGTGGDSIAVEADFQGDSAVLTFDVAFSGSTANYTLELTEYDTKGVIAFKGSQTITLKPGDNPGIAAPVLVPAGPDATLKSISVTPNSATINSGATAAFTVSGTNSSGQTTAPNHVAWTTSNSAIATVDDNGVVTAGGAQGATWVVARMITGLADSAKVTVHAPVAKVNVAPAALQLVRGDSGAVAAELRDASGNLIDDRSATWSSSDPTVATIASNGVVRALKIGTATLTASAEGKTGTATVTVVSPIDHVQITPATLTMSSLHETQSVTATIVPRTGASVAGIALTYSSSNSAVASVDANGTVTANANGSATITATAESFSATASVTVQQVAATISISPKTAGVNSIGDSRAFSAAATDALGNAMAIPFTWSSSDVTIAKVDANGVATAVHGGTATITASIGSKSVSATFNVIPVPRSISISLDTSSIKVGSSTNAHASFADATGNALSDVTPAWSTTTPSIISIGADGRIVGLSGGLGKITASAGSLTGTTTITVVSTDTVKSGKILIYGPSMDNFSFGTFSRTPRGGAAPAGVSAGRTVPQPNARPSGIRASSRIRASFNTFSGAENELTLAQKAGLDVTVVDAPTWASMSRSDFAKYSAIVFGDNDCSSDPIGVLGAAFANASVWLPLVTGRVVLIGTDYVFHQQDGGMQMVQNALKWVSQSSGTALFASLSCYYFSAPANTPVSFLSSLGTFSVVGQDFSSDQVLIADPTHPIMAGVTAASLSNWGESIHEMFTAFPASFQVLATSGDGKPYVIAKP